MLNRYYVDVSALTNDEIVDLRNQFNNFAFETFEKFSKDNLRIIGLDVFVNSECEFNKNIIPPQCKITKM